MTKRNEGHIVAVGSIASFSALSGASMYVATKHGVMGNEVKQNIFIAESRNGNSQNFRF